MAAGARKHVTRTPPKKALARPPKAAVKPARPIARVSTGARGKLAVLANDPEFQKQVARHIEAGVLAESLVKALVNLFANAKTTTVPPVSDEAMKAAEAFLAEVAKHNGPPPTEAELDEMIRSWA